MSFFVNVNLEHSLKQLGVDQNDGYVGASSCKDLKTMKSVYLN